MTFRSESEAHRVGGRTVAVTQPEKVLFPNDGITKRGLVAYYERIAPIVLPHIRGRPFVMERYPDGINGRRIFQKNAPSYLPAWIRVAPLTKKDGIVRHVVCDDESALAYLGNQAVITPHTWLSRIEKPNRPDDFRSGSLRWRFQNRLQSCEIVAGYLLEEGLNSFAKTTGSRGLHVLVPLNRHAEFDTVRAFAATVAKTLVHRDPEHLTTEVRRNKRKGRLFVDTTRNAYAQTAAPAHAVRPRDSAPVAVPLEWIELDSHQLRPDLYNIRNIVDRLDKTGDPWKDLNRHAQRLPKERGSDGARGVSKKAQLQRNS